MFLPVEKKLVLSLGSIYTARMLGLFMILPVLSTFASEFTGAEPLTIGFAIGVYGLVQALCQFPSGWLSDTWGRRKILLWSLGFLILGGVIAAEAESIWGVILGRAVQGTGAMTSVVLAMVADHARLEVRSKVMAILGILIGTAFLLAMMLGPWIAGNFGLRGVFWVLSGLGVVAYGIAYQYLPQDVTPLATDTLERGPWWKPEYGFLFTGIGVLHVVVAAMFLVLPTSLVMEHGIPKESHAWVYVPVLLGSLVFLWPLLKYARDQVGMLRSMPYMISLLTLSTAGVMVLPTTYGVIAALIAFFVAFNWLEAALPAFVSIVAPSQHRGRVMGVYATCQFLGIFVGGAVGGAIVKYFGVVGLVIFLVALQGIWLTQSVCLGRQSWRVA